MHRYLWLLACAAAIPCRAQMNMDQMNMNMGMNMSGMLLMQQASGASMNPQSWRMPMFMPQVGSWTLMLMGQAFLLDTQQWGARGNDKLYSVGWFMVGATHEVGRGSLMLEGMFSQEPATITGKRYPELFQTGETAYGKPIVDGQHPHNFVMALSVAYQRPISDSTFFEIYLAPVGDPALGPVAFPHRASASELPQAPLGHHWQDSTHISYDVVTAVLKRRWARLEASGFHGAEPGENRWTIGYGAVDSWSTRASVFPTRNWMAQVSVGRLTHPEALEPGDVVRATASAHYSRPTAAGRSWSSSLIWGRNHNTFNHRNLNSLLAETVVPVRGGNFLTGRWELVDKDELLPSGEVFRIGAYTGGFTHDLPPWIPGVETGIGANATAYTLPASLHPYYGTRPFGGEVYLRFRLKPAR
jgi:hypothetical protein